MGEFETKFLIDGIDRLGKTSLVAAIQQRLGYFLKIHYDKPKVTPYYLDIASALRDGHKSNSLELQPDEVSLSNENFARKLYQEDTNLSMFELMKSPVNLVFDRTHLGEMVYAPLYRGYSGEYVFDLEKLYVETKPFTIRDTKLILLTTSNFEMLVDDGLSFDPNKKEDEQRMFVEAFNRSHLPNKVIVDVHNGEGGYKSFDQVFNEAIYSSHRNDK